MTKANTKAIVGDGRVEGVELADGTTFPADLVVMAVGIRPNAALAKDSRAGRRSRHRRRRQMRTSDPDDLRARRMRRGRGQVYGLVAPLYEMANVAAAQLAGDDERRLRPAPTRRPSSRSPASTSISAGDFAEGDDREEIVLRDAAAGVYKRLVLKDDRIVGAVLYGDTADGAWFFDSEAKSDRHRRDARHPDLRPGLPGRAAAGPYGGRCSLAG